MSLSGRLIAPPLTGPRAGFTRSHQELVLDGLLEHLIYQDIAQKVRNADQGRRGTTAIHIKDLFGEFNGLALFLSSFPDLSAETRRELLEHYRLMAHRDGVPKKKAETPRRARTSEQVVLGYRRIDDIIFAGMQAGHTFPDIATHVRAETGQNSFGSVNVLEKIKRFKGLVPFLQRFCSLKEAREISRTYEAEYTQNESRSSSITAR